MYFLCAVLGLLATTCRQVVSPEEKGTLFTMLPSSRTNIDFVNQLDYDAKFNIFTYRNFYNGGGVALGDINNDGLLDIYFTSNMGENKLYLNKGDFEFEDITEKAGVAGTKAWSTGVSMADVNGDGFLDIYVCNSGDVAGDNKQNELFINNGDLTFTESAETYGLADQGFSTHAVFFDYDNDGDLDLYLLNNSYKAIGSFNLKKNERPERDPVGGDKLFRNDNGEFVDVSEEAGIYGSIIGFGLGVTVGDINGDGWMDIYVSNDFFERDYIYMNNQDGTFTECLERQMKSISGASMGADMADINNDGFPDIFVTEMLPEGEKRIKTKTTFENWDKYQFNLQNDYYHQFTRNMLHLNNGLFPGKGKHEGVYFSEIGRLAGVHATDWSWGALITDFDNDGFKDIFVANGILQDLTDQDYIQYISNDEIQKSIITGNKVDYQKLIDVMPSNPIPNYMFVNKGEHGREKGYGFTNLAEEWGLAAPSFSNGSAYGDLNNNGALDLVVNNVNMPAFIYRNGAREQKPENHFLKITLKGESPNTFAVGSKVTLKHQGQMFYQEQMPMRGFQSTVDHRMNFGLGNIGTIDSVIVEWPDKRVTVLTQVMADQVLTLKQKKAKAKENPTEVFTSFEKPIFEDVTTQTGLAFSHRENQFVDFDRDRLIFHMLSTEGPKVAVGDVNGDGLDDFYVCGAKDSPGALFLQRANGTFRQAGKEVFEKDKISEDVDCLFFDANGNGHLDLYVASGGNEFPPSSSALLDRLYLNDGRGNFEKAGVALPFSRYESTGCVKAADFDGDGDLDLFVGTRLRPFQYGLPVNGYLLENDGSGNFREVTKEIAPGLASVGMVTDALWLDYDGDGALDLVVVGEWMPISVFRNNNGKFENVTGAAGLSGTEGWWNTVRAGDLNGNGHLDLVLGNHGLNSRFRASGERPARMYVADFDRNGTAEQVITTYNGEDAYPMVLRHDLVMQMPGLKKKFLKYESYQGQKITDIFPPEQLEKAHLNEAKLLETTIALNNGDGTFVLKKLPLEAQFSPIYGILLDDFDGDGHLDILMGGNFYHAKPEVGRYDASYGTLLKGDGQGNFETVVPQKSGLFIDGQVRDLVPITIQKQKALLVGKNNEAMQVLKLNKPVDGLMPDL